MISFSFHFEFSTVSIEHTHTIDNFFFSHNLLVYFKMFFSRKKTWFIWKKKLIEGSAFLASIVDETHQKKKSNG